MLFTSSSRARIKTWIKTHLRGCGFVSGKQTTPTGEWALPGQDKKEKCSTHLTTIGLNAPDPWMKLIHAA